MTEATNSSAWPLPEIGEPERPLSTGYVTVVDGARLFYCVLGSGIPELLVPNGVGIARDLERLVGDRTVLYYDLRNRGYSDTILESDRLAGGIRTDVADLDALRRHLDLDRFALLGHSYVGKMVALYALRHPRVASRIIQIAPVPPDQRKTHTPSLPPDDDTVSRVLEELSRMPRPATGEDPVRTCQRAWQIMAPLYVTDPANVGRVRLGRCELPNERGFLDYFNRFVLPSIESETIGPEEAAAIEAPVLTIHGEYDRSTPFAGGEAWAALHPRGCFVPIERGGHLPWIENESGVRTAITEFLAGSWPSGAKTVPRA